MDAQEVLLWLAGILTSVGIVLKFIDVQFVQPRDKKYKEETIRQDKEHQTQIAQLRESSITNKRLAKLNDQLEHQNELHQRDIKQIYVDLGKINWEIDKSYELLDGRIVKVEKVIFPNK